MQAPTHAAFGLVFVILAGTVLGLLLTPAVALFACLGALLPDIDTPTSIIGKACLPLSRFLERRFGHRTLTHSFLGLALASLPLLPFVAEALKKHRRCDKRRRRIGWQLTRASTERNGGAKHLENRLYVLGSDRSKDEGETL